MYITLYIYIYHYIYIHNIHTTIQNIHQSHDYECQGQPGIAHSGFFIRLYLIFREIHEENLMGSSA